MLSIVFVEDEEASIAPVRRLIDKEETDIEVRIFGFDEGQQAIRSIRPDIVVLDLWEGHFSENRNRGSEHLEYVWEQQFCPVIIHSANPDVPPEHTNTFVREVTKGQHSPQEVLDAIRELRPHVKALKEAEDDVRNSFSIAMRDVAPSSFDIFADDDQRRDAIRRAGRRRLAALMDETSADGEVLASWEQYICPPVSEDILLGDVLRKSEGDRTDPASFRVVLTPSCDLDASGGREAKVGDVLVAKCVPTRDAFDLTSLKGMTANRLKDRLIGAVLSRGYFETILPLPALQDRIPTMVASLRDLELIPLCDIGIRCKPFLRIASLDSPFREMVSWAYLQVSGRPGVPERDFESWRDEIIADYQRGPASHPRVEGRSGMRP